MNIKQEDFYLKALVNDTCQGHFAITRWLGECLLSTLANYFERVGVRLIIFAARL